MVDGAGGLFKKEEGQPEDSQLSFPMMERESLQEVKDGCGWKSLGSRSSSCWIDGPMEGATSFDINMLSGRLLWEDSNATSS